MAVASVCRIARTGRNTVVRRGTETDTNTYDYEGGGSMSILSQKDRWPWTTVDAETSVEDDDVSAEEPTTPNLPPREARQE